MAMEAWFMDESDADPRLPHHLSPKERCMVPLDHLAELGLLYWRLNPKDYVNDEQLRQIREPGNIITWRLILVELQLREPPSSIGLLRNLKRLSSHGCRESSSLSSITSLLFSTVLKRCCDPIALSLPSLSGLHSLTELDVSDCHLVEEAILNDISCLTSLKIFNISRNLFVTIPGSICKLPNLRLLRVEYCQKLQKLAELPCSLEVWADNCISLETLSHSTHSRNKRQCEFLSSVYCINCFKLVEKQGCGSYIAEAVPAGPSLSLCMYVCMYHSHHLVSKHRTFGNQFGK